MFFVEVFSADFKFLSVSLRGLEVKLFNFSYLGSLKVPGIFHIIDVCLSCSPLSACRLHLVPRVPLKWGTTQIGAELFSIQTGILTQWICWYTSFLMVSIWRVRPRGQSWRECELHTCAGNAWFQTPLTLYWTHFGYSVGPCADTFQSAGIQSVGS